MFCRRSIRTTLTAIAILFFGFAPTDVSAEVRLPGIFGEHMVLQRDVKLPVWGWAEAGEKVSVRIGDAAIETTADAAGKWSVRLPALAAGGPLTLEVRGTNTIVLEDVLIGEVWLCSGQSNMQWLVNQSQNFEEEQAAAGHPRIRHITIPRVAQPFPVDDVRADWEVCSPETVGGFSAAAYFFGRTLHQELDVPIGLINSSWGGTRIEPWTPPVGFTLDEALADIHKQVLLTDPSSDLYKESLRKYMGDAAGWLKTAEEAIREENVLEPMPAYPQELRPFTSHQQPTMLYNAMIHPLVPFAIRGAIWYQGESNHTEGNLYAKKTLALVGGWRKVWNQNELPLYYVQIAPFQYGNENPFILAEFWEAQAAALAIPGTGMAVINDIGNLADIHPKNKQEVGRRLALLALKNTYGQKDLVASGPTFRSMEIDGRRIRIHFDHTGSGLASRDGKPLSHFELIGEDTDFVPAEAVIEGDSVVVSSPKVEKPMAIRFAWHKLAEPNLMNKEGLPAGAFRAGEVPQRDYLALKVPEAKQYQLVYELDLAKLGREIAYDQDLRDRITAPFDRVAYFLELQKPGEEVQWVYVSMEPFSDDLAKIGMPALAAKARFQQRVAGLNVLSNVEGIATGEGLTGGNIEFWSGNYGPPNAAKIPGASDALWDFGDEFAPPEDGYGCMQVHNHEAGQTIFAINQWKGAASADVGIGNSEGKTRDWTFVGNAGQYIVKKLRVLVRPSK
ncbi:MAG: sialate O-acetylesterase [Rhodopirellula sp.]|nr:sialate O-acetylesterase [Rhodopirellula sp.]